MKIVDYFLPPKIIEKTTANLTELEKIKWCSQARFQISITIFVNFAIALISGIRIKNQIIENDSSFFLMPFMFILLLISLLCIKFKGNIKINTYILILISLIFIPIRTYTTGGHMAPNLLWYFPILLLTSILLEKLLTKITFVYLLAIILVFHFIQTPDYVTPKT